MNIFKLFVLLSLLSVVYCTHDKQVQKQYGGPKCKWNRYRQKGIGGQDVYNGQTKPGMTARQCQLRCDKIKKCKSIMYGDGSHPNKWYRNLCWIKKVEPKSYSDPMMVSNRRGLNVYVRQRTLECGYVQTVSNKITQTNKKLLSLVTRQFKLSIYKSGCGGSSYKRGQYRDVGHKLSLSKCLLQCATYGKKYCNSVEFGGRQIGYKCRIWTGTCSSYKKGKHSSNIYMYKSKIPKKSLSSKTSLVNSGRYKYLKHTMLKIRQNYSVYGFKRYSFQSSCLRHCNKDKKCKGVQFWKRGKQCYKTKLTKKQLKQRVQFSSQYALFEKVSSPARKTKYVYIRSKPVVQRTTTAPVYQVKSFVSNQFRFFGTSNCKNGGRFTNAGYKISLENCQFKCLAVGDAVCKSVEFGGRDTKYVCRMWSGTCQQNRKYRGRSKIYLKGGYNQFQSGSVPMETVLGIVAIFVLILFCIIGFLIYSLNKKKTKDKVEDVTTAQIANPVQEVDVNINQTNQQRVDQPYGTFYQQNQPQNQSIDPMNQVRENYGYGIPVQQQPQGYPIAQQQLQPDQQTLAQQVQQQVIMQQQQSIDQAGSFQNQQQPPGQQFPKI